MPHRRRRLTNVPLAPTPARSPPAQAAPTMSTGSFVSAARAGEDDADPGPPPTQPDPGVAARGAAAQAVSAVMDSGASSRTWPRLSTPGCHRSRWSPWTEAAATGTSGLLARGRGGNGAQRAHSAIGHPAAGHLGSVLGWSMGGYGALLLGNRRGPARTAAICAVSPALWLSAGSVAPASSTDHLTESANSVSGLPRIGVHPDQVRQQRSFLCRNQARGAAAHPPAGGFSPGNGSGAHSYPPS